MVKGQLHGMHSGGGSPFSKKSCVRQDCPIRHRGWDETGLHVGSARHFGGSIGTLVTADADVARKPAEVNVEARCFE